MAELVFSTLGQAIGGRMAPTAFRAFGAALGQAGGAMLGRAIDNHLFGQDVRREGPRLTDLHLQGSTEGASIPVVYGRVRIAGQVIWAARFKERVEASEQSTGGKGGGPSVKTTNFRYSLSFAVGLCEGEIARIGRVWANGEAFDLSEVGWRLHTGARDQAPDPLIEAIEGAEHAPAYRGLAYVVFEDLPLERFGNAIPQLSFEIVRPTPAAGGALRLEDRVKGVCLIPGAGEFVYATAPVLRRNGPGQDVPENVHVERERANFLVSLDQLAADFPNCERVLLVVAWFGDDLRSGACSIRPAVEIADKVTTPVSWSVNGVTRAGAHLVSLHDGAPAFGGTPSDASVLAAIAALKARGYSVGLYPLLLMDVPADNALPDPYGGEAQAAYPWRGRVTVHPAAGEVGSADKTSAATAQVAAFFGDAAPDDFDVIAGAPTYSGPAEWSYRRFVLHYAKLAALAGGVDAFVLGSELRGLTTARDSASTYPAVDALISLAADVRELVGDGTTLTYGADWSEYGGHRPQDGSGDVFFHLDPLWADDNIDVVGVDWYPPLTDWRTGAAHLDAQLATRIHDPTYLASRIEAGENYDWYYASDAHRASQTRTPITDGAHSEPWIYRAKDLRNFWSRPHHNRPGGARDSEPTAWTPESKPIWLIELGCPAIDKGANTPNLFVDAKSSESAVPHFSTGARDDLIQRRTLEAYLAHWDGESAANPVSSITGVPMIESMFLWCWDARPHPAFPARGDVWADGASWRLGHWLNGRAGLSLLGEVVADICARSDVEADVAQLTGAVSGYVGDAPASGRALLEPLMAAYDFIAGERDGEIVFFHRDEGAPTEVALGELSAESAGAMFAERADAASAPVEARVRFLDPARDYLLAGVGARRLDRAEGGVATIEAPLVLEIEAAETLAQMLLADRRAAAEALSISLGPLHMGLEPGDRISLADGAGVFEIVRVEDAEARSFELRRARSGFGGNLSVGEPKAPPTPPFAPTPAIAILDVPPLPGSEDDDRPLAAVFASPWLGAHALYAGPALTARGAATQPAVMGELLWALWPGPVDRWDNGNVVRVKLYGGALASATSDALLAGGNTFAIETSDGEYELMQVRNCVLVAPGEYQLSGFLRGQLGSAHAMRAPHPVGARIVQLDQRLVRINISAHEWREALDIAAPPAGILATDARAATRTITLPHAATRQWAPAHVRAIRAPGGDIAISWIRCARSGGDAWGAAEPPLGAVAEAYQIEIWDGAALKRTQNVSAPSFLYAASEQTADFGGLAASFQVRIAQIGEDGALGVKKELTIAA